MGASLAPFLGDELQAIIKHMVEQQTEGHRPIGYGHLASYDPKTSRARFIIPSFTDDGVDFVLTSWAPLHTGFTGAGGWGMQAAPIGGATKENPTAGELCVLNFNERQYGVVTGAHLVANQVLPPPAPALAPGEIMIKGKGGQTHHFLASGDVSVGAKQKHMIRTIDDKAEHRVQTDGSDGYVISQVTKIDNLKIYIGPPGGGGTWYHINLSALTVTAPPPGPPAFP